MSLFTMLTQTCTVQRPAQAVSSATGEVSKATWTNAATNVLCAIQATGDSEAVEFGRRFGTVVLRAYFLPDADVRIQDRLTSVAGTGASPFTGKNFEVISPVNDTSGRGNHVTCLVREHV